MIKSLEIKRLRELKKYSQQELANMSGVSKRTIISCEKEKKDIVLSKLQKIALALNVSMFDLIEEENQVKEQESTEIAKKNRSVQSIPLVNVQAVGGFGNSEFTIHKDDIKEYFTIPVFKHRVIDFMIRIRGHSMAPRYVSGDIVACTIIRDNNYIQWNKTHIIATKSQGIIMKRIQPGVKSNHLKMVSNNPDYSSFEVPEDDITGIALVAGGVVLE